MSRPWWNPGWGWCGRGGRGGKDPAGGGCWRAFTLSMASLQLEESMSTIPFIHSSLVEEPKLKGRLWFVTLLLSPNGPPNKIDLTPLSPHNSVNSS